MYKELPKNHNCFQIDCHWCGDDSCSCHYVYIWSLDEFGKRITCLWESNYVSFYYDPNYDPEDELRQDVQMALDHYNWKIDISGNYWDWEEQNGTSKTVRN